MRRRPRAALPLRSRRAAVLAACVAVLAVLATSGSPSLTVEPPRRAVLHQTGTGTTSLAADRVAVTSADRPGAEPVEPVEPVDGGEAAEAAADATPAGGLAFVDQTDWVRDGAPFDLRIRLGADVAADASLVLELYGPTTSRSQFRATLTGELLGPRRAEAVVPVAELAEEADGSRRIRLTQAPTVAPGERPVPALTRPGVYPVVVSVRPADPSAPPAAAFTTYLVRTAEEARPLQVAVIQPVAAPLAHRPDGEVALPPEAVEELAVTAEILAGSDPMPLTIAPRPETLDALMDVADADPAAAVVLERLARAAVDRQVVSGPYVDVPLDALEAAGLGEDLAAQRRRGDDAIEAALGVRTDPRTWVQADGAGPDPVRRLATLGVDQIVLPDAGLSPVTLRLTLTRPFSVSAGGDGFALEATAPDPGLSAWYEDDDPVLAAQLVLADLAVLHGDQPGPLRPRGVVVAPPAGVAVDPDFLRTVLAGIDAAPILEPVTLDAYFRDVDPEGEVERLVRTLAPSPATVTLGISAAEVEAARSRLVGYDSMVADQTQAVRALHDLTLLAEAGSLEPTDRRAYLAGVGAAVDRRLGRIGVVDGAAFRLPDSEGTIPLTIVQEGSQPLLVRVTLQSERLEFGSGDDRRVGQRSYDLELTSENTPLVVPVRVRSPGSFPLFVTITSPDGRLQVVRSQVTIRSTAFSGVGVALSAGAGLFLLLWWGRHWRTVRRARRLVPVP